MKIALLGYGKMGQAVERVAKSRYHKTVMREEMGDADIFIDFSHPDVVLKHIGEACEHGKELVIGTTGWDTHLEAAKNLVESSKIGVLYSPNFSISTHLYANLLKQAAHLFGPIDGYDVAGYEIHHREKGDSPSGTAKMLSEELCKAMPSKKRAEFERSEGILPEQLHFASIRCGSIPGTHTVLFDSAYDTVEITLRARSREGWALGAVMAAEWLHGRQGFFTMSDMLHQMEEVHA